MALLNQCSENPHCLNMVKVSHIKVYPYEPTNINIIKTPQLENKHIFCPCKLLETTAILNRLLGRFPYTWKHINNKCVYEMSVPWILYSVTVLIILLIISKYFMPFLKFDLGNLPDFLDALSHLLSVMYVFVSFFHGFNAKLWINMTTCLVKVNRDYLFCQQARKLVKRYQRNLCIIILIAIAMQNVAFLYLKLIVAEELSLHIMFFSNLHILAMFSFTLWCICVRYYISMFTCFENVTCNYLSIKPVHPSKDIKMTHNEFVFIGFSAGRTICDEKHFMPKHLRNLTRTEIIEYLRIKHEQMCSTVDLLRKFTSPQLLFYVVIETAGAILNLYSLIIIIANKFDSPVANSTFVLNWVYLIWHSFGIFWFIENVHNLTNIIKDLKYLLLLCMINTQNGEERQQLRIFIQKLDNQKPFLVNDLFVIDLGIVGPVAGSILTYVLVALQFGLPPQKA